MMKFRKNIIVMLMVLASFLVFGCADNSLPEPEPLPELEPEDITVSDPVEPESEDDSVEEIDDSSSVDGSTGASAVADTEAYNQNGVIIVSGAEAKEIYAHNDSAILLDVRNQEEFDEMNIVDSLLIPVDDLASRLSELPDKDAVIIVFCRAGRRSEVASGILVDNGYTSVFDMGAITNWD